MRPKHSLNHNIKSVPLVLTGDNGCVRPARDNVKTYRSVTGGSKQQIRVKKRTARYRSSYSSPLRAQFRSLEYDCHNSQMAATCRLLKFRFARRPSESCLSATGPEAAASRSARSMDFRRTICDYQLLPADLRGQIMEMPYAFVKAFHWHTLVLAMSKHLVRLYENT